MCPHAAATASLRLLVAQQDVFDGSLKMLVSLQGKGPSCVPLEQMQGSACTSFISHLGLLPLLDLCSMSKIGGDSFTCYSCPSSSTTTGPGAAAGVPTPGSLRTNSGSPGHQLQLRASSSGQSPFPISLSDTVKVVHCSLPGSNTQQVSHPMRLAWLFWSRVMVLASALGTSPKISNCHIPARPRVSRNGSV